MKKEALINIIINDLREIEELMEAFKGESTVSEAFVSLAKSKLKSIDSEIELLKSEFGDSDVTAQQIVAADSVHVQKNEKEQRTEPEETDSATMMQDTENDEISGEKKDEPEHEPVSETVNDAQEQEKDSEDEKQKTIKVPVEKQTDIQVKEEVEPADNHSQQENDKRIADVLQKNKSAVNERVALKDTEKDLVFVKPVDDVRKAMGINDRFLFQRELFNGNNKLFEHTLDQLNDMSSFDDARRFLESNFNWDMESDVTASFFKMVKRRFL
ncbi:MAG: hypothetical protein GXO47_03780 [Chlorobi bacterium]|nr:hypothetical protein [Chlorobiota bacterium]